MRSKEPLVLMEQLIMVLVFALAAALCLSVFAGSHRLSREAERKWEAALLAENAAQLLKAGEDPACLDTGELTLEVIALPSAVPGYLEQAQIRVSFREETVYTLRTGWQVSP